MMCLSFLTLKKNQINIEKQLRSQSENGLETIFNLFLLSNLVKTVLSPSVTGVRPPRNLKKKSYKIFSR